MVIFMWMMRSNIQYPLSFVFFYITFVLGGMRWDQVFVFYNFGMIALTTISITFISHLIMAVSHRGACMFYIWIHILLYATSAHIQTFMPEMHYLSEIHKNDKDYRIVFQRDKRGQKNGHFDLYNTGKDPIIGYEGSCKGKEDGVYVDVDLSFNDGSTRTTINQGEFGKVYYGGRARWQKYKRFDVESIECEITSITRFVEPEYFKAVKIDSWYYDTDYNRAEFIVTNTGSDDVQGIIMQCTRKQHDMQIVSVVVVTQFDKFVDNKTNYVRAGETIRFVDNTNTFVRFETCRIMNVNLVVKS